jgi:hypothetical protein
MKLDSAGILTDNIEAYVSDRHPRSLIPRIDIDGTGMLQSCFSAFYNLVPYLSSDRAPRPSISSAQLPQAVCLPFCPAEASVSPVYVGIQAYCSNSHVKGDNGQQRSVRGCG